MSILVPFVTKYTKFVTCVVNKYCYFVVPELGPSPNPPSTASQEHFHFFLKVSTAYLMAFVIKRLDNAKNKQDIEDYRRVNTDLEAQSKW